MCDPDNDYKFEPPETIYYPNNSNPNKCKYAYATLLMIGDSYLPGLLTLAYTIRKMGSKIDIIAIVTKDVSAQARNILKTIYTHIIEVPYIIPIKGIITDFLIKNYPHYEKTFTKINIFNLTQYEKILFLDADTIVLKNFDSLFNLETPAAIYYGSHKIHENNYQPRKLGDKYIWHQKFCDCCGHGKKIPYDMTKKSCKGDTNFGSVSTECMLIKPDTNTYKEMIRELNDKNFVANHRRGFMSDTGYITCFFSGKWIGIDPRFLGKRAYPRIEDLFGIALGGAKPWVLENVRFLYPDYKLWYKMYFEFIDKYNITYEPLLELKKNIDIKLLQGNVVDVRILLEKDSTSSNNDAILYKYFLEKYDKNIQVRIITNDENIALGKHSDVNIFIDTVPTNRLKFLFTSKSNILLVNSETFSYPNLKKNIDYARNKYKSQSQYNIANGINLYLCKTLESVNFMHDLEKKYNTKFNIFYTRFTSIFESNKNKPDYNSYLYNGNSVSLQPEDVITIIKTWSKLDNPPKLTILCHGKCYKNLLKYKDVLNMGISKNITLLNHKIDTNKSIQLKHNNGIHICPNYKKINEARMSKAIVITIDKPPMNELIDTNCGMLMHNDNKINSDELEKAINKLKNITDEEKYKMGINAYKKYKEDVTFFKNRIDDLIKYIKGDYNINLLKLN